MYLDRDYFKAQVYAIWRHGPLGYRGSEARGPNHSPKNYGSEAKKVRRDGGISGKDVFSARWGLRFGVYDVDISLPQPEKTWNSRVSLSCRCLYDVIKSFARFGGCRFSVGH